MQKRHVLWWMILFQIVCNTLVTISLDISIVSMVTPRGEAKTEIYCSETFVFKNSSTEDNQHDSSSFLSAKNDERYDWTDGDRSTVLGGFYLLNYLSILPGGILTQKFGSKLIGGSAQLISSAMAALIPTMAWYGPGTIAWLRAIQGFLSHMSVPASINTIMANWCPPQERGKFGSLYYAGAVAGQIVGNLVFGYVAEHVSWAYVFYLTSFCGIIWAMFWYLLIHDTPSQHPSISVQERDYILGSLKEAMTNTKVHVPYMSILISLRVNAATFASNSVILLWVMMATYGPTYLHKFYGIQTNMIGILTGASNIGAGILIFVTANSVDYITAKKILSFTLTRKLTGFIGCTVLTIPMIILAFTDCNFTLVVVCLILVITTSPLPMFGSTLSISDMSPVFFGIIQAIAQTSMAIQSLILVRLVKYANDRDDWDPKMVWKMMFLGMTLYGIVTQVLFLIFGTSELQPFNFQDDTEKKQPKDSKDLHIKVIT